jgi:hypothetical protein
MSHQDDQQRITIVRKDWTALLSQRERAKVASRRYLGLLGLSVLANMALVLVLLVGERRAGKPCR